MPISVLFTPSPHLAGANVVRLKENVISLMVQNLPDLPKTDQLNPQFACCSHWANVGRDLHLNANISTPSPLLFGLRFYHSQQVCHAKSQRGYFAADLTKIALALENKVCCVMVKFLYSTIDGQ